MLTAPKNVDSSLMGDAVGSVAAFSDTPSLAEDDAFSSGLSNVSGEGTAIYAVSGLDTSTAVAAEVGGKMRLSSASATRAGVPADRAWRIRSPSEGW